MARFGWCSECGRYVNVRDDDSCENGHGRSSLRDIREGVAPAARPVAQAAQPPAPKVRDEAAALRISKWIGVTVVVVPVVLIVVWGLATGFAQGRGSGMSTGAALGYSVGTLVVTVGSAFVWAAMKKRNRG